MKSAFYTLIAATVFTASQAQASTQPALDACKQGVVELYTNASETKFKRQVAISQRGGQYTFWINASATIDGDASPLKAKCVTSKSGEIVSLQVENGRWR